MTQRDSRQAIEQMLEFAERVLIITQGRTQADLDQDRNLRDLIEHNLTKLGEASRRVPEEERNQHAEIPWVDIMAMRNRLIHVYDQIDYDIVWDTVQSDLPALVELLKRILR